MTTETQYIVRFNRHENDSFSVGAYFNGEQIDELRMIIFNDTKSSTSFWLDDDMVAKIVELFARIVGDQRDGEYLRDMLWNGSGRVHLDVTTTTHWSAPRLMTL